MNELKTICIYAICNTGGICVHEIDHLLDSCIRQYTGVGFMRKNEL